MFVKVYWIIYGLLFPVMSLLSLRFPRLAVSRKVEEELSAEPEKKRRYYLHTRINLALLGIPLMLVGILPEPLILWVGLPICAILFVSGLVCHKVNLGRFFWKNIFMD